jgi:hypothetical protein
MVSQPPPQWIQVEQQGGQVFVADHLLSAMAEGGQEPISGLPEVMEYGGESKVEEKLEKPAGFEAEEAEPFSSQPRWPVSRSEEAFSGISNGRRMLRECALTAVGGAFRQEYRRHSYLRKGTNIPHPM